MKNLDPPATLTEISLVLEAIHSVALSHEEGCGCLTCKAADGDTDALVKILIDVREQPRPDR